MSKRILSVSYDEDLLVTRRALLEKQGYQVTSALGFTQSAARCAEGNFDLFILGHSIRTDDKHELIRIFRANCAAPVLALRREDENPPAGADHLVFSWDPAELLKMVARILSRTVAQ
jgi:DNA-binding response OmpR family regulator